MKLSAPKQITFWIAVALAVIGVILRLMASSLGGWLILIAFVVLAAGNLVDSL
jgi:flagellin-like protein